MHADQKDTHVYYYEWIEKKFMRDVAIEKSILDVKSKVVNLIDLKCTLDCLYILINSFNSFLIFKKYLMGAR